MKDSNSKAYIAGLVASDGTITVSKRYSRIKIITNDKDFSKKINRILKSLGYNPHIYRYNNKYEVTVYSKKTSKGNNRKISNTTRKEISRY